MKKIFSSLFLTLALGIMLGAFCDAVKAEDYSSEFWESVQSDLSEYNSSNSLNDVYNAYISRCSNYGLETDIVKYVRFPLNNDAGVLYLFAAYEHAIYCTIQTFSGDLNQYYFVLDNYSACDSYTLTSDDNGHRFFALYIVKNNSVCFANHRTQGTSSLNITYLNNDYSSDVLSIFHRSTTNTFDVFYGQGSYYNQFKLFNDDIVAKGDNYFVDDNFKCIYYTGESINWVEDDRLNIYTLETLNGKELNLNLSDFMGVYSAAVSVNFTDITVILNCDNTDYTFQLSDQNSELYKVWEPYAEMFICKTLYSVFDVDQFSDVYLTAVSFNEVRSSAGGSFTQAHNIACNYVLKETSAPLEPDVIPDPTYNNTFVQDSQQLIQSINDLSVDSSFYSSGSFTFEQPKVLPDWADICDIDFEYGLSGSDTVFEGEFFYYPIDSGGVQHVTDQIVDLNSYIFERYIGLGVYYDIIRLRIFRNILTVPTVGDVNISYYDTVYIYLYSERYLKRKDAFTNLDILQVLQLEAENNVMYYEYVKDRLDDLAEDMDSGFNGFLDLNDGTQYKIIGWLQTIDNDITGSLNNIQGVLTSGFSDVVSAINNIVIPSGGSSYSLPALSDELEYLFKPSLEWSAINYNDYVESLGVLALPFEFTFDVLDIAENQYDSDLKLHINQLSVDLPLEAGSDPETTSFIVLSDQDVDFQPTSVIPATLWSTLQYLNAFGLVLVQALGTYNHIFRGGDK